jgi:hypothetical protein
MGNSPVKLTNEQKIQLDGYTDKYRKASSKERKGIMKVALAALFPTLPHDHKDAKRLQKERVDKFKKVVC